MTTNVIEMPSRKQRMILEWQRRKEEMRQTELYNERRKETLKSRSETIAQARQSIAQLYGFLSADAAEKFPHDERDAKNHAINMLEWTLTDIIKATTGNTPLCRND